MYRAAIIGCGRIASDFDDDPKRKGSVATHAGAYTRHPETELICASDLDEEKLNKFGEKWGVKKLYTDYSKMLEEEKIDILSVCTWSSTHLEIVKKAAKSGIKAMFCEKPVTESLAQADEMIEVCKKNGVILMVNHGRRWDKLHHDVRQFISSGQLGDIQSANAYYTAGIANTGTHMLDIMRFFFGDARWVTANFEGKEPLADPSIDAYVFFDKGFGATISGLNVKDYMIFELDIYGTKGRLRVENSGFSASLWPVIDHPKFSNYKCLGNRKHFPGEGLKDTMLRSIENIVGCLKEKKTPFSTGEDGRAALELICAIHESGKAGGKKIQLPMASRDAMIRSK